MNKSLSLLFLLVSLSRDVLDAVVQGRRVTDRTLCGRCEAIAGQLYKQLGEETPRNDIDLRARLSDSGLRQGKVIPYRRSEARVDALLDALCPSLSKHTCTADGAWVDRERKEETPEDLHHARTLMNTCTDILHMEEDRISAWLISGASEDPSLEAVSALVCQGICSHSEPGGEAKPEL